jgi:hypothetical protein
VQGTSTEDPLWDCLHHGLTSDQSRALSTTSEQALAKKLMHVHPVTAPVRIGD